MDTLLNYKLDKKETKPKEELSAQTITDIQSRLVNLVNKQDQQQAPNMPQAQQASGFSSVN